MEPFSAWRASELPWGAIMTIPENNGNRSQPEAAGHSAWFPFEGETAIFRNESPGGCPGKRFVIRN